MVRAAKGPRIYMVLTEIK